MKLIPILVIALFPFAANAQTTHQVCNSGCQFSTVQAAYDASTYGDRIELRAGENFGKLNATSKGAPPTNTERDYITITTSDPSGIPAALSNYPRELVRPTTAMAAKMPKMRTNDSGPVVIIGPRTKWVRFEGVEFTSVDTGVQTIRLVQSDFNNEVRSIADMPDHISFRRNWFHPPQETGAPMSAANIARSVENALYLDVNNSELIANAFTGFAGRFKYGNEAGNVMTSSNWLITLGEGNVARNNFFGAWTYAVFSGGSGIPRWAVTGFGTVSNCQGNPATQCDFSSVAGLTVGTPISIFITTSTSQNKWGAAFIKSISGSTVTFERPLCQSFDGSNSCTGQNGTPANGDRVQWDGHQPRNYLFERNAFVHDPEWDVLLGECGGKGYDEIKSGINFTFNANLYEGCTGHTITVRNQNGDFPWASVSGLKRTNNFYRHSNNIMVAFCQDVIPTRRSGGLVWHNNLAVGAELNSQTRSATVSGGWTNCDNLTVTHNTVAWNPAGNNFTNFGTINGVTIKDNIFPIGQNACFKGSTTVPMTECWPGADVRGNVLVNLGKPAEWVKDWWGAWPGQAMPTTWAGVGFVRAPEALDASGDYHLAATSPFKGKATDGKDPGADVDAVMSAVFGAGPLPTPQPTPVATPLPTPVVTPTPAATIAITATLVTTQGRELQPVTNGSTINLATHPPQLSMKFTPSAPVGSIRVQFNGGNRTENVQPYSLGGDDETTYVAVPLPLGVNNLILTPFTQAGLSGIAGPQTKIVFTVVNVVPTPSPSPTPVSTPTPQPTPSVPVPTPTPTPAPPTPTPTPSPSPSPSPTPVSPFETTDEPWPTSESEQRAVWKRLTEAGWKCTHATGRVWCWRPRG